MKRTLSCFAAYTAAIWMGTTAFADVKTLYSWESPEGTVIEEGGYASYFNGKADEDRVNYANGTYHTLCLNGKKANMNDADPSANAGQIVIGLDEGIQAGDSIYVTAYKNKGTDAKASIYAVFDDLMTGQTMADLSGEDSFNDIKDSDLTPNTVAYAVPEGVSNCFQIRMTRKDASTNLFITKLVIKGERTEQEEEINYYLNSVDNLNVTSEPAADGKFNVTISFVTPTTMMDDVNWSETEIDTITAVKIFRNTLMGEGDGELVYTFEGAAKGAELSWTEQNVPMGSWFYTVHVYSNKFTDSWGASQEIVLGELPADFQADEFTLEQDEKDEHKIRLYVTVPSLNSKGEKLNMPITKIVIGEADYYSWPPSQKILDSETEAEYLTPGEKIMFTLENVKEGEHTYFANAFTAAGSNNMSTISVFIGHDVPGMVGNLNAEKTENGILVSWTAPTSGQNDGNFGSVEDLTYTVLRGTSLYDTHADTVAKNIKELQFLDVPQFDSEKVFCYIVYASCAYGDGYPKKTDDVVAGPACPLPFAESFDAMDSGYPVAQNSWIKTYEGGNMCAWQVGESADLNGKTINPRSGKGLLYAYHWSTWTLNSNSYYTSGHINFSEANAPQMTLWIYENNLCADTASVKLRIQTSTDDVTFTDVKVIEVGKSDNTGWAEVTVDLESIKNLPSVQIRLNAEARGRGCISILVDDINIVANATSAIESVASAAQNNLLFNLNGQRTNAAQKGIKVANGKVIMVK